jgi:hypothetical protein
VQASGQLHVDETLWLEGRHTTWLWVFTAATVTLYAIAGRGRAIHESLTDSGQQSDFSSASQIFFTASACASVMDYLTQLVF